MCLSLSLNLRLNSIGLELIEAIVVVVVEMFEVVEMLGLVEI